MIITWRLGPYEVRSVLCSDAQFGRRYNIFLDGVLLGHQERVPTISDAKAHEEAHGAAK